jgi:predicted ribosomally synthesized peptide with SipW-like signal peptide
MSISRPLVALVGVAVLGLAGIGVGAGATFTDQVQAQQTITAGTLGVSVTSPTGSQSSDGRTVTLAAFGPASSTFTTGPSTVNVNLTGNIPATEISLHASAVTNGGAGNSLRDEMYVRIFSSGQTFYNGTLAALIANGPYDLGNGTIPDSFQVTFYAGGPVQADGTNGHGSALTPFTPASLTNASQGGVVIPSITLDVIG